MAKAIKPRINLEIVSERTLAVMDETMSNMNLFSKDFRAHVVHTNERIKRQNIVESNMGERIEELNTKLNYCIKISSVFVFGILISLAYLL